MLNYADSRTKPSLFLMGRGSAPFRLRLAPWPPATNGARRSAGRERLDWPSSNSQVTCSGDRSLERPALDHLGHCLPTGLGRHRGRAPFATAVPQAASGTGRGGSLSAPRAV